MKFVKLRLKKLNYNKKGFLPFFIDIISIKLISCIENGMNPKFISYSFSFFLFPNIFLISSVQLLCKNHKKSFSYKINLESFNLKARHTEHLYQLMQEIRAIASYF